MSNNSTFRLDDRDVINRLKRLNPREITKAEKNGLKKSGKILRDETKRKLKIALPKATHKRGIYYKNHKKLQYKDSLMAGIKLKVKDTPIGVPEMMVHILGTHKTGSGSFRLRFFEGGTGERTHYKRESRKRFRVKNLFGKGYLKTDTKRNSNGKSLGSIKPLNFFRKAYVSKGPEVINSMEDNLKKSIEEIFNKNH